MVIKRLGTPGLKAPEFLLKDETLWSSFGENVAYPSEPASLLNFKGAVECKCSQVLSNRNKPEVLVRLTTRFSVLRRAVKSYGCFEQRDSCKIGLKTKPVILFFFLMKINLEICGLKVLL